MDKINYLYNAIVKHLNNKCIFHDDNETQVINENYTKKLPYEIVNIILEYDGRIKYKYKDKNAVDYHTFVNVIHKHDTRYNIIKPIIHKKHQIITNTQLWWCNRNLPRFYFEVIFDNNPNFILCYDYNWAEYNQFEICYTDFRGSGHILGSDQIRTIHH
jgi:hypothetical protein